VLVALTGALFSSLAIYLCMMSEGLNTTFWHKLLFDLAATFVFVVCTYSLSRHVIRFGPYRIQVGDHLFYWTTTSVDSKRPKRAAVEFGIC